MTKSSSVLLCFLFQLWALAAPAKAFEIFSRKTINADQVIKVKIVCKNTSDDQEGTVFIEGPLFNHSEIIKEPCRQSIWNLDRGLSRATGYYMISLAIGQTTRSLSIKVLPGMPKQKFDLIVGPKSVIADRSVPVFVTTIPSDRLGNPLEEGTTVAVTAVRPSHRSGSQQTNTTSSSVIGGLAWIRLPFSSVSGVVAVGATSGGVASMQHHLVVYAGTPRQSTGGNSSLTLDLAHSDLHLSGIRITDKFNNPVEDGNHLALQTLSAGKRELPYPVFTENHGVADPVAISNQKSRMNLSVSSGKNKVVDLKNLNFGSRRVTSSQLKIVYAGGNRYRLTGIMKNAATGFLIDQVFAKLEVSNSKGNFYKGSTIINDGRIDAIINTARTDDTITAKLAIGSQTFSVTGKGKKH